MEITQPHAVTTQKIQFLKNHSVETLTHCLVLLKIYSILIFSVLRLLCAVGARLIFYERMKRLTFL